MGNEDVPIVVQLGQPSPQEIQEFQRRVYLGRQKERERDIDQFRRDVELDMDSNTWMPPQRRIPQALREIFEGAASDERGPWEARKKIERTLKEW